MVLLRAGSLLRLHALWQIAPMCYAFPMAHMLKKRAGNYAEPGTFGYQFRTHREALPNKNSRREISDAIPMSEGYVREIEYGWRDPPPDVAVVLRMAEVVRAQPLSLMHLALKDRGTVVLDTDTPFRVRAAASLACVWADLTDEQLTALERLALSFQR